MNHLHSRWNLILKLLLRSFGEMSSSALCSTFNLVELNMYSYDLQSYILMSEDKKVQEYILLKEPGFLN